MERECRRRSCIRSQRLTFGVNASRSFHTIASFYLRRADRQLRRCGSWVQRALDVTLTYPLTYSRHPTRIFWRLSDGGWDQISTEILNEVASVGPSSLTTMVGFNTFVILCSPQSSKARDTLGMLMSYRFCAFPARILFPGVIPSPAHCGGPYTHQSKPLLRFPLVPTRLGKDWVHSRSSFNEIWGTILGGPHFYCGVTSDLPQH